MAATFKVRKVNLLPALPVEPNTMFLVKSATSGFMDFYLSNSDGTSYLHTITRDEVMNAISNQLAAAQNSFVVADITARNALAPTIVTMAYVIDASADPMVTSGAAQYIYNPNTTQWYLVAEYESQIGPNITWASITDKPTSSVASIDQAVTNSHTHANKASLDRLGINISNHPTVDGNPVLPWMSAVEW